MTNEVQGAAVPYDRQKHYDIWRRVAPSLTPYGEERPETAMIQAVPAAMTPAEVSMAQLPGAEQDPCCMGTAAQEMLAVVEGFAEEELQTRQALTALARRAPASARPVLLAAARRSGDRVRKLLTVRYLITGSCYRPAVSWQQPRPRPYCAALRERYHDAVCQWMNCLRAAESTTDPCLRRVFQHLAADKMRLAERLTELLEQALTGTCGP